METLIAYNVEICVILLMLIIILFFMVLLVREHRARIRYERNFFSSLKAWNNHLKKYYQEEFLQSAVSIFELSGKLPREKLQRVGYMQKKWEEIFSPGYCLVKDERDEFFSELLSLTIDDEALNAYVRELATRIRSVAEIFQTDVLNTRDLIKITRKIIREVNASKKLLLFIEEEKVKRGIIATQQKDEAN